MKNKFKTEIPCHPTNEYIFIEILFPQKDIPFQILIYYSLKTNFVHKFLYTPFIIIFVA